MWVILLQWNLRPLILVILGSFWENTLNDNITVYIYRQGYVICTCADTEGFSYDRQQQLNYVSLLFKPTK